MLPNGWKKSKIGEICSLLSGQDFSPNLYGNEEKGLPYITGASNFAGNHIILNRWTEHPKNIAKKGDILLVCKGSGFGITAIADFEKAHIARQVMALQKLNGVDRDFLYQVISMNVRNIKQKGCGLIPGIDRKTVLNIEYLLPPLEEQKKIAATLSVWDSAIEKMEKLIDAKENSYACFLASSIKTNAYVELGVFLTEVSERNKDEKIQQVLSVSNSRGFILPEEQFDRKVASENLSNYKIVRLGQYAYNPSRINVGSIARLNDWNEAVISPMYTVFEIVNQEELDSDFLLHWLNSSEAKQRIKNSAQGSVRETVGFGDLCKIKIPRFDLKKQQKIVSVLNAIDEEISLLRQQLENYKKQKQGLMQKLLTGQWRVK